MAITNHERVGKALELLRAGLGPFVERELLNTYGDQAGREVCRLLGEDRIHARKLVVEWDAAALLKLMWEAWNEVFRQTLGYSERSLLSELRDHRNRWAHQEAFSGDDTYRVLDSTGRMLTAVSAPQTDEIEKMKTELLRIRFDEQVRSEKRKSAGANIESSSATQLKPWREVITPHQDVAGGHYRQAEFAADLWQVHLGQGADEYRDPVEFFRRTYLTESLQAMLIGAVQRLTGKGGDPVVQLQTNFGGGKTHSMLALYHLFSGTDVTRLAGIDAILKAALGAKSEARRNVMGKSNGKSRSRGSGLGAADFVVSDVAAFEAGASDADLPGGDLPGGGASDFFEFEAGGTPALPGVRRVVLVGNRISPGNPVTKPDGTIIRTLWGEIAWQLGGKKAYRRIQADDEKATNPGDVLRELLEEYGPCLILIDEWVAYARQLHDKEGLPAGTFETQFTFAQLLTESAKLARNCLLVISLPASDTTGSPHTQADDVEVGGQRGREALDRLRNVVGRIESSWRPATAEEGFEIVRRRLFQPLTEPAQFKDRDVVARAFSDFYRTQRQEFPHECGDSDYENRIKAAYPIHPEIFDRLYTDWSTLVKFQRTRGVLRLMASVIHSLWEKGDRNPLILPATIPIDDARVQSELTHYLSDNWVPVIAKDVDGPNALPLQIDGDVPNLGKFSACRRVARAIYLGSAPLSQAAHRGIEDRRIKLGCVLPGESPTVFGDALRRLAGAATYLYQDGPRYWYSTQPTVTKLAEDRAEQLRREPDKVVAELHTRVRKDLDRKGDFARIHPMPQSNQDVPDDLDTRLVVLGIDHPYSKEPGSSAESNAKTILESRGNTPRLYRNTLVFLAADKTRLQDLDEAARKFLAWESILAEKIVLNLDPQQVKQAENQKAAADSTVAARLPETYQWLLVPTQAIPQSPVTWQAIRLSGQDALAVRVSKKLKAEELMVTHYAATRLRMELDRIPLWRGDQVAIRQLAEDFASYLYLTRMVEPSVLVGTIRDGVDMLTWETESFAFAESYDQTAGRYRGLRAGQAISLTDMTSPCLLVKPDQARIQMDSDKDNIKRPEETQTTDFTNGQETTRQGSGKATGAHPPSPPPAIQPKRYHGTVKLDANRVGRDAGRIAEEVIAHLAGIVGARVTVTLEIEAEIPGGASDQVVRTVTENSHALRFTAHGFEKE